jgi:Tfp pilus assembly protein PilP
VAAQTKTKVAVVPASKASAAQSKNSAHATAAVKPHDIFSPKPGTKAPKELHWAPVVTAEAPIKSAPKAEAKPPVSTTKIAAVENTDADTKIAEASKAPKPEEKKWAMTGKRDPFFSPIVQQSSNGSGCSTGKKCLEIGQINVRGVVKSENGFIAVVTNGVNKAYFLHESDPVFNGYVLKITGDSVVFQETVQDKFGKPLTREVVKRILTPAV